MRESRYQRELITRLREMFPGCLVMKNDSHYAQGIPDILILYNDKWAMLEIKASAISSVQPNQEYYVGLLNDMSFASFINPENEEEVLSDLQQTFGFTRSTRIPQS